MTSNNQARSPLSSAKANAPVFDHANDTVDALTQAESFVSGFEGDHLQEGIDDMLAGLRAAIRREQARPDLLSALKALLPEVDAEIEQRKIGGIAEYWQELKALSDAGHAAVTKAEGR